ncbi:hypothetical protein LTR12_014535 [Friedmanniomyces endolithicus]|nr:hypothetical protein LTR12_014535 [Friedmanniomyces endolithicus]
MQPNHPSPLPHPVHVFIFLHASLQQGGEQRPEAQNHAGAQNLDAGSSASVRDRHSTARRTGYPRPSRRRDNRWLGRIGDWATRSGPGAADGAGAGAEAGAAHTAVSLVKNWALPRPAPEPA